MSPAHSTDEDTEALRDVLPEARQSTCSCPAAPDFDPAMRLHVTVGRTAAVPGSRYCYGSPAAGTRIPPGEEAPSSSSGTTAAYQKCSWAPDPGNLCVRPHNYCGAFFSTLPDTFWLSHNMKFVQPSPDCPHCPHCPSFPVTYYDFGMSWRLLDLLILKVSWGLSGSLRSEPSVLVWGLPTLC